MPEQLAGMTRDIKVFVAGHLIVSGDIELPFTTELDDEGRIKVTMTEILPNVAKRLREMADMMDEYEEGLEPE